MGISNCEEESLYFVFKKGRLYRFSIMNASKGIQNLGNWKRERGNLEYCLLLTPESVNDVTITGGTERHIFFVEHIFLLNE